MMAGPTCPIETLPNEILLDIFSYLGFEDLKNVELVNILWHQLESSALLWQNLLRNCFPYLQIDNNANTFVNYKDLVKTEYLKLASDQQIVGKTKSGLPYLLSALKGDITKIESAPVTDSIKLKLYTLAASNGHRTALSKLDDDGKKEALYWAAKKGQLEVVKHLCVIGGINGALKIAAEEGHLEVVKYLLSYKNLDYLRIGNAFQFAGGYGHLEIVKYLLEQESQAISADDKGCALSEASKRGHYAMVKHLLEHQGHFISESDKGDAFTNAVEMDHQEIVKYLLGRQDIPCKGSALCTAVHADKMGMIQFLLQQERSVVSAYDEGNTLWNAAKKGYVEVVIYLFAQNSQAISAKYKGWALDDASEQGHLAIVKYLLKQESQAISAEHKGRALRKASEQGHLAIVKYLLKQESHAISAECKLWALKGSITFGRLEVKNFLEASLKPSRVLTPIFDNAIQNNQTEEDATEIRSSLKRVRKTEVTLLWEDYARFLEHSPIKSSKRSAKVAKH